MIQQIEFYKINEIQQHKYIMIPKELLTNSRYKDTLNSDAKMIYGLLLDRMELSRKNNWVNEKGEIYLIFKRELLKDMLGLSEKTITKAFKQLSDVGLIFEKRQGLGQPNLIYIGKIIPETLDISQNRKIYGSRTVDSTEQEQENLQVKNGNIYGSKTVEITDQEQENLQVKNRNNYGSRTAEFTTLEPQNLRTNLPDNIIPEINKSVSLSSVVQKSKSDYELSELEDIKQNCELNIWHDEKITQMLENALEMMFFSEVITVNGVKLPQPIVRRNMHRLNGDILTLAYDKFKNRTGESVKNSSGYLMSCIYNAINEYTSDAETNFNSLYLEMDNNG